MDAAVVLQIFYRYEFEVIFFCNFPQFRSAHHCSVFVHNFTAQTALLQSGKAAQINSRFRVSVAHKNSAFFCNERKHMTRTAEVRRNGRIVNAFQGGNRAFCCAYACCGGNVVYGYGECRFVIVSIFCNHRIKSQLEGKFFAHRRTDKTFCVACHKVYVFLGGKFRGTNHISFVFALRVIRNKDNPSCPEFFQRFFNRIVFIFHFFLHKKI